LAYVSFCFQFIFGPSCSSDTNTGKNSTSDIDTDHSGDTATDTSHNAAVATQAVTSLGEANGFVTEEGVVAFLGIPFAEPPVGELRFAPPVPLKSWSTPLDAFEFGSACPQPEIEPDPVMNSKIDEDCLTLNIWTPAVDNKKRAVMFWIHGGGYLWESSGDLLYKGARVAARGDVVVVSVEYRLGAVGFSYFEEVPGSGNAGLLDQVLALRFVQEHIRAFGGDPDNVTIWGESAGSYSVCSILGMPDATGLFHKAIGQSGGSSMTRRPDFAMRATELLYEYAGVGTLDELRALSWQEVIKAQEKVMTTSLVPEFIYGPVLDGMVFSEAPLRAIAKGESAHVPLLLGSTRDEARMWMVDVPVLATPLATPLATMSAFPYLQRALPPGKTPLNASFLYESTYPQFALTPNYWALAIATDVILRIPTLRHAEAQVVRQPEKVFVYRFDWVPPSPGYPNLELGSAHGAELGFTMGYPEGWPEIYGNSGIPSGLRDQIMDAWIAFAKTGNPNHVGMPQWQPYNLENRPTMIFDAEGGEAKSFLDNDPGGKTRAFWEGTAFDGLDPPRLPQDLSTINSLIP
jgi:para-nitrobenzyl esterase